MIFSAAVIVFLIFGSAMYGWGGVVRRGFGLPDGTWPMTILLGLSAWIAVGGLLNLMRLAYPPTIYLLLAAGSALTLRAFCVGFTSFRWTSLKLRAKSVHLTNWIAAFAIIGFALVTQSAPTAFNRFDDYEKYFAYAARMIQTGTLSGSPLNSLGSETFGGQAFLQAPFVAVLPFAYINAADAVFCFSLIILLIGGTALRRPAIAPVATMTMLLVWVFEPQYLNVSALYSAASLIFGLVVLSFDRREFANNLDDVPPPAALGLIYAALVALKPTFALFCLLHFASCITAESVVTRNFRRVAIHSAATAIWGLAFISPWLLLYSPLYWTAFASPAAHLFTAPIPRAETLNLLATQRLVFGGSYAQYTLTAATSLICGAVVLTRRRLTDLDAVRFGLICASTVLTYLIMLVVLGPLLAGYLTALRYVLPVLVGATPSILLLSGLAAQRPQQLKNRNLIAPVTACMAALLVVLFLPDAFLRGRSLLRNGTMLAYLPDYPEDAQKLVAYGQEIFQRSTKQEIARFQEKVPKGEPILAWTSAPFLLDFARNPIVDIDLAGTATPWAKTPRISYVLWQYAGYGVKQSADYLSCMHGLGRHEAYLCASSLTYMNRLQDFFAQSRISLNDEQKAVRAVADDGQTVLLQIGAGNAL